MIAVGRKESVQSDRQRRNWVIRWECISCRLRREECLRRRLRSGGEGGLCGQLATQALTTFTHRPVDLLGKSDGELGCS